MRKGDIVTAVILLAIGILLDFSCIQLGAGWGTDGPQAGFWPFIMALGMTIGSMIVLVGALQRKGVSKKTEPFIPSEAIKPVLQCVIPATLMVLFTEFIGKVSRTAKKLEGRSMENVVVLFRENPDTPIVTEIP